MNTILKQIQESLRKQSNSEIQTSEKRFFKEEIKVYGVKTPNVIKIAKANNKLILSMEKNQVFDLCEDLWKSGYMEEAFIACHFSYLIHKQYKPEDFNIFESWINKYVTNWATCDTFCNHTIGTFIEMYPQYLINLKNWAKSENRWVLRTSAVSLIVPAKRGKFLKDVFEIADILLINKDDLVQKGYGWMLKSASQAYQKEVFDYIMKNKSVMPRTALRYAIEKMPKDLKVRAMQK